MQKTLDVARVRTLKLRTQSFTLGTQNVRIGKVLNENTLNAYILHVRILLIFCHVPNLSILTGVQTLI